MNKKLWEAEGQQSPQVAVQSSEPGPGTELGVIDYFQHQWAKLYIMLAYLSLF